MRYHQDHAVAADKRLGELDEMNLDPSEVV